MTVNEGLSMQKILVGRLQELKMLRSEVAVVSRYPYGGGEKVSEPRYNVVEVDKKITALEMALFQIDNAIKQSNAVTKIEVNIKIEELLEPLK